MNLIQKPFAVLLVGCFLATTALAQPTKISEAEVLQAQKAWCQALVNISQTYKKDGRQAATKLAEQIIDQAYGYGKEVVLFKPTLTSQPNTFRNDKEGALSYFVGGNEKYPDKGFALKGWTNCQVANSGIHYEGKMAITMGNVSFTNDKGEVTTVDKTWAFKKDAKGNIVIVLHHSSLPFIATAAH